MEEVVPVVVKNFKFLLLSKEISPPETVSFEDGVEEPIPIFPVATPVLLFKTPVP